MPTPPDTLAVKTPSFRVEHVVSTVAGPRRSAMGVLPAAGIAIAALLLVSAAGAVFPPGAWYDALLKPAFTPPDAVFGPAWAVLYAFNAVALTLVLRSPRGRARRDALVAMGAQLALNALWTPVFFGAHSLLGGLVVITAMLVAIAFAIARVHRVSRVGAWLLVPYLGWVAFATLLNLSIWMLNA